MDNKRADDSNLVESIDEAPSHSGQSGGSLQRDIGSRAEQEHGTDGEDGVTRVRAGDKPEEADLPRFNQN